MFTTVEQHERLIEVDTCFIKRSYPCEDMFVVWDNRTLRECGYFTSFLNDKFKEEFVGGVVDGVRGVLAGPKPEGFVSYYHNGHEVGMEVRRERREVWERLTPRPDPDIDPCNVF